MKRLLIAAPFLALLFLALPCYAQTNLTTQWDVRTGGSNTNGGAYDPTVVAPGTDESQGNTGTSESCVVQTTTTNMICTPAISATTHGPGNYINFTSGVNCTLARFEILSQSSGTATLSGSTGTAASVCLGTLGGSMATVQAADTATAAENLIYIQGAYIWTAMYTRTKSNNWVGYTSVHGDGGRATITTSTASMNILVENGSMAGAYLSVNIDYEDTTGTNFMTDVGLSGSALQFDIFINCKINGFAYGINTSGSIPTHVVFASSELSHLGNTAVNNNASIISLTLAYDFFHDNGTDVASPNDPASIMFCSYSIFSKGSDATSTFQWGGTYAYVDHCNFGFGVGNQLDLLMNGGAHTASYALLMNSMYGGSPGGGAIEHQPNNYVATSASMLNNGFWNNATPNAIPYLNPTNINPSVDPWVSPSTGNYGLNATSGGGALLQGTGTPTAFGTTTTTGTDVGAVQRAGGVTVTVTGNFGSSN